MRLGCRYGVGFGGMCRCRVAWGKEIHRQNRNGKGVGAGG